MATSFLKRTMVYLGLLEDEYDEYDEYEERAPRGFGPVSRPDMRMPDEVDLGPRPMTTQTSRIRTLPRDNGRPSTPGLQVHPGGAGGSPARNGEPPVIGPGQLPPTMRAKSPDAARVHVVAPSRFADAKEIADVLKGNRPVIVNLQIAERDLQRRMIDFCSGVTYALSGEMEKVADQVFLLTPTNVTVSEEERQRLQERGFGRQ